MGGTLSNGGLKRAVQAVLVMVVLATLIAVTGYYRSLAREQELREMIKVAFAANDSARVEAVRVILAERRVNALIGGAPVVVDTFPLVVQSAVLLDSLRSLLPAFDSLKTTVERNEAKRGVQ